MPVTYKTPASRSRLTYSVVVVYIGRAAGENGVSFRPIRPSGQNREPRGLGCEFQRMDSGLPGSAAAICSFITSPPIWWRWSRPLALPSEESGRELHRGRGACSLPGKPGRRMRNAWHSGVDGALGRCLRFPYRDYLPGFLRVGRHIPTCKVSMGPVVKSALRPWNKKARCPCSHLQGWNWWPTPGRQHGSSDPRHARRAGPAARQARCGSVRRWPRWRGP